MNTGGHLVYAIVQTDKCIQCGELEECASPFFITPPHGKTQRPSSEELSPFLESGCCYVRSLSWLHLKIVPL